MLVDDQDLLEGVANSQRGRCRTLKEMAQNSRYFFEDIGPIEDRLRAKQLGVDALELLSVTLQGLEGLTDWTPAGVQGVLAEVAVRNKVGLGKVAQPLRIAVTGGAISPPIDVTLALLGPARVLERLRRIV